MHGTIFNVKVKPEGWEELRQLAANEPQPPGAVGMMVFQMDADPCKIYTVAMAESEKAYRAISESPERHEAYTERRQWFEADPEWHDGRVVMFQHNTFQLAGQEFMALNGDPEFGFTEAISLFVNCAAQEEIDDLWA